MAGIIFILIVLLMTVGAVCLLWFGHPMLIVNPIPSYFIVEDEGEPVDRVQTVWHYLPQQRARKDPHEAALLYSTWAQSQGRGR